jgi:hypothetical protein
VSELEEVAELKRWFVHEFGEEVIGVVNAEPEPVPEPTKSAREPEIGGEAVAATDPNTSENPRRKKRRRRKKKKRGEPALVQ